MLVGSYFARWWCRVANADKEVTSVGKAEQEMVAETMESERLQIDCLSDYATATCYGSGRGL